MTNDLDNLLEQVEDVLEEDGSALWQPDLTSLVLPQAPEDRAKANPQDSQAGAYADPSDALAGFSALEEQQALPRFQRAGEDNSQTPGSNGSDPQDLPRALPHSPPPPLCWSSCGPWRTSRPVQRPWAAVKKTAAASPPAPFPGRAAPGCSMTPPP